MRPLSPSLFGLYVEEISDWIEKSGTTILIPLYAEDFVLISDSPKGLKRDINALCTNHKDFSVNFNQTKVVLLNYI